MSTAKQIVAEGVSSEATAVTTKNITLRGVVTGNDKQKDEAPVVIERKQTTVDRLMAFPRTFESDVPMKMTFAVWNAIRTTIGAQKAETGGILGGDLATGVITHFYFDETGSRSTTTYSPDTGTINRVLKEVWNPAGVRLMGFAHSHPIGSPQLSSWITGNTHDSDLSYARGILHMLERIRMADPVAERDAPLARFFMPVIQTEPDSGMFDIRPYSVARSGNTVLLENTSIEISDVDFANTFNRVENAYDLKRLARCRVIYIGAGGASQFVEDMARAGVGEHVLIDPDVVSETNLATQQVYRRDIGRAKVQCIGDRVRDINPNAVVVAIAEKDSAISDEQFENLAKMALRNGKAPLVTLICGLTDSFEAQARVNRLALQLGIPSLNAQVYREGRGAEITFTHPDTTPACHRCILSGRYRAYLQDGFQNDVTSHGTPIFSTTRLNALKGFISMALLHHGMEPSDHMAYARFGKMLKKIGKRNLVQIRMDSDIATTVGLGVFDKTHKGGKTSRIFSDDTVWMPQECENPANGYPVACPDCGGVGNLGSLAGVFGSTMEMRS